MIPPPSMSQFASANTNNSRTGEVRAASQYNPHPTAKDPDGQSEYRTFGFDAASLQEPATLMSLTPHPPIE